MEERKLDANAIRELLAKMFEPPPGYAEAKASGLHDRMMEGVIYTAKNDDGSWGRVPVTSPESQFYPAGCAFTKETGEVVFAHQENIEDVYNEGGWNGYLTVGSYIVKPIAEFPAGVYEAFAPRE